MKKLFILLINITCLAQSPAIQWQKSFGESNNENTSEIKQTPDGGYIIVGSTNSITGSYSNNHGGFDILVIKINSTGGLEWQKLFGGSALDYGRSIVTTSDGGYLVAGYTASTDFDAIGNHGNRDYIILKLNSLGNLEWKKCLGGSQDDYCDTIINTSDGGYALAGYSGSNDGDVNPVITNSGCWILKLDTDGNIIWQKSFQDNIYSTTNKIDIKQTPDNAFFIEYVSSSPNGITEGNVTTYYSDIFIKKIDSSGNNIIFQRHYGGSFGEAAGEIAPTSDSGFVLIGESMSNDLDVSGHHGFPSDTNGNGNFDLWIMKADSNGNIQWQKSLGGSIHDYGVSVKTTSDGGYIILGSTTSNDGDVIGNHSQYISDYWLIRLNSIGSVLWKKCFGGTDSESASNIAITNDNGYILAGNSTSSNGNVTFNNGLWDTWIVKLGPDSLSNSDFSQNKAIVYPNPANNFLNINLDNNSFIDNIVIIDISGKIILEQKQSGTQIEIESISPGCYILEAFSGENKYQFKFIKQK
ncbi:MAG: hypothetical protein RIQ59_406 [Bacteroidota bacterium]|jgi:hypothetical protein